MTVQVLKLLGGEWMVVAGNEVICKRISFEAALASALQIVNQHNTNELHLDHAATKTLMELLADHNLVV